MVMIIASVTFVGYGLLHISPTEVSVHPQRQPLYVQMSDGQIQNSYQIQVLNKTSEPRTYNIKLVGLESATLAGTALSLIARPGAMSSVDLFVRSPLANLDQARTPIDFILSNDENPNERLRYSTLFNAPTR
jgi:polyferredoxin